MWPLLGKWLPSYRLGANAENSVAILVQDDCSPAVALLQDDASLLAAYDACQWCLGTGSRMLFPQSSFHIAPLLASCAKVRLYPLAVLALLASDCSKASMNLSADTIDSSYHIPPEMESDATIHLQVSEHRLIQQCRVHVSTTTSNFLIIRGIYFASAPEVIAGITDAGVLCFMLSLTASVGLEIIHDIVRCAVQAFRLIHPDGTIHCLVSPTDTALESALTTIGFTNTLKELSAKEGNCTVLNDGLFFVAEISALPLASVCPEAISLRDTYFLIGQSNMAGRGSVADIYSESTKQSISGLCPALKWTGPPTEKESFYCYDPKEGWVMNSIEMHRNVDILKRSGVGPGYSFGVEMSRLMNCNQSGESAARHPFLIPAAIGATSIEEWMPSFFLQSSPADSTIAWPLCSDSGALVPPNNAVYHMDGVNILGCALRSAHETVTSSILYASESSLSKVNMLDCTIGGILWYQGCNDAADTEYVATELYKTRFPKLMSYIRDAIVVIIQGACRRMNSGNVSSTLVCADDTIRCYGLSIPIVSVAITSTRPMLKHIKHIRQYQINEAKMVVPNMAVVDAYGAALSKDSIHLECKAYIILGHIIKKQLCTLQAIGSAVLSSNVNDRDFVHSCYLFLNNSVSILKFPVSNEMDRSNEALFTSALSRAHENLSSINGYMKYNPAASLVFATDDIRGCSDDTSNDLFPVLKSKLKTVNFVYGELSFIGMCQVLRDYVRELCQGHKYGEKQAEGLCFVDLGSGAGVSIAAAVLSGFFSTIIGVELMRTKVNICRAMISQLKELGSKELRFIIGGSILPPQSVECTLCTTVDIIEGDFLLVPWWTVADVVYAACTCFSEDLMQSIVENVLKLKCGSLIVLLDRPILVNLPQQFELLGSFEAAASWGETAVFVYQKI